MTTMKAALFHSFKEYYFIQSVFFRIQGGRTVCIYSSVGGNYSWLRPRRGSL